MKRYPIALLVVLGILMTACKKDIEIDYRQVSPLYAVEASVSNEGMQARISQTNDMDDNTTTSDISGATVVITGSDGTSVTLPYVSKGIYKSMTTGIPGVTYTIDIQDTHIKADQQKIEMESPQQIHLTTNQLLLTIGGTTMKLTGSSAEIDTSNITFKGNMDVTGTLHTSGNISTAGGVNATGAVHGSNI